MDDRLVLCYHAVSERWPAVLAVPPGRFEEQLRLLAGRGYRGRTFSDALLAPTDGRVVAVTFDDAYLSVFEYAFPILAALGMPATVFVPTALAGRDGPMSWPGVEGWLDGPYASELTGMCWEQLAALADAGWEIGSHTRSHARLTDLGDDALADELRGSREDLEAHLGRPCHTLAYPYDALDARAVAAAGQAGYRCAAAPPNRLGGDPRLRWPRVSVYRSDDLTRVRVKVARPVRRVRASRGWPLVRRLARGA